MIAITPTFESRGPRRPLSLSLSLRLALLAGTAAAAAPMALAACDGLPLAARQTRRQSAKHKKHETAHAIPHVARGSSSDSVGEKKHSDTHHLARSALRISSMAEDGLMSPHANAITGGADDPSHAKAVPPPARVSAGAHFASLEAYRAEYAASVADPAAWWAKQARETLDWFRPFSPGAAMGGSFAEGDVRWFSDGQLNVCYNCVRARGRRGGGGHAGPLSAATFPLRRLLLHRRGLASPLARRLTGT